jgi:hypothetical protein
LSVSLIQKFKFQGKFSIFPKYFFKQFAEASESLVVITGVGVADKAVFARFLGKLAEVVSQKFAHLEESVSKII